MRMLVATAALALAATVAKADTKIDPATVEFPVMAKPPTDAVYKLTDHPNTVFVLEAFSLRCDGCNKNAPNVDALATEFAGDARVQVLDMGQDVNYQDYKTWIINHAPNHPVVKDVDQKVFTALSQDAAIPQTLIVQCDGELVDYTIGPWGDAEKQTIHNAITKAKLKTCP